MGAQVREVEQRQSRLVGVVEHQAERGLLGVVEAEHLRQQRRAERRDGRAQRDPGALTADREELHRETSALPLLTPCRLTIPSGMRTGASAIWSGPSIRDPSSSAAPSKAYPVRTASVMEPASSSLLIPAA